MCGIFGFYLNRPLNENDLALGKSGVKALSHRGPDNSSYWVDVDNGVFLGHRRLSIIDLSDQSNQPMIRHDAVLIYNGEIYNYKELGQELSQQGVSFSSTGDTEVLLQAWHMWGAQCVNRFDGMFAFALYYNRQLHLVTDPFGEKPIYWAKTDNGIYFSSEANPLVNLLKIPAHFPPQHVAAFLSLGFLPAPHTGYANLYRMPPATRLVCLADGQINESKYWEPPQPQAYRGPVKKLSEQHLDRISDALVDSLRVRLRADVPLGIFLSSGTDSALVAALAAKELNCKTLAFTVKFPDKEVADESETASAIAKFLDLPHKVVNSQEDPVKTDPSHIFDLFGEANDNITVAAAYQMSRTAESTLKVALSGIGGDELFYGYNKYEFLYKRRRLLSLNVKARNFMSALIPNGVGSNRLVHWTNLLSASDAGRFIAAKNIQTCRWLSKLPEFETWAQNIFSPDIPIELLGRHFDLIHTLPSTYIPAMERGSMRASIEVRTPYLNKELLSVVSTFDQRSFIAFGQKSILRRILARYLPQELVDLPKRGFNYPMTRFLGSFFRLPEISILPDSAIEEVWQRRHQTGWQRLAIRLVILAHFIKQNHS